jgi:hypothetical protein
MENKEIKRFPCGCAFCDEVCAYYVQKRRRERKRHNHFDALLRAVDPPHYRGIMEQLQIGAHWPGILINVPASKYWIRNSNDG